MDTIIGIGIGMFLGVPFGFFLLALMMIASEDKRDGE
jgi:hypothetical protein